jgi:flagellar hook assembly protein FlgD
LDQPGKYQLSVLDINGRLICTLNDNDLLSMNHTLYWNGTDHSGTPVVSGVYFFLLETDGFSQMKRMVKM